MIRYPVFAALLSLAAVVPRPATAAQVDGIVLPDNLPVAGHELRLAGCGTRETLFVDVYVAGLYLPRPGLDRARILAPETAKAVRLHIVYDGTLPDDVPESWHAPLRQMAEQEVRRTLKDVYEAFSTGDAVTVQYAPEAGTTISVNGTAVSDGDGHTLIDPLLRLWIGERAISENLRRLLLQGRCEGADDGLF